MKILFEEVFPHYVHVYGNVISIPIIDTDDINRQIDTIRIEKGKRPFFNGADMDENGWYEVRLIIDSTTYEPQEIEAWVAEDCGAEEEDNEVYHIELDDPADIKRQLDYQMKINDMTFNELKKERA